MKTVFFVLLILFAAVSLIIFAVDLIFYLTENYSRFHIGRWNSDYSWQEAVIKKAKKWALKTPVVRKSDNSRYMSFDILSGKYRSENIQSWQTAPLILTLFSDKDTDGCRKAVNEYIDKSGNWKKVPENIDSAVLAYAILKTESDTKRIKPAMDKMVEIICGYIDDNGLLSYRGGSHKYVDTIGLVCPFLCLYATVYNKHEYERIAYRQIEFYNSCGLLHGTFIPCHAVDSESKLPLGVYGWGRGCAWYILGIVDSWSALIDGEIKSKIKGLLKRIADYYMDFQHNDGGFGSMVQIYGTYDSSVTAVMAYFYMKCYHVFTDESYLRTAEKCMRKLKSVTKINGSVDLCQGDTKGIGVMSHHYGIMPFAQGYTALAVQEYRNIKTDKA